VEFLSFFIASFINFSTPSSFEKIKSFSVASRFNSFFIAIKLFEVKKSRCFLEMCFFSITFLIFSLASRKAISITTVDLILEE